MSGCPTQHRVRILALFLMLLLLAAPGRAEERASVKIKGENEAVAVRLSDVRKHLAERKWSEAVEELQSILNSAGNDLAPITPDHSVSAIRLCQVQLASLPAEALRLYRQRYENQARKKLQQARSERDVPQLRKLVEDFFCSRAAEKALDLLGDLAFERGRFAEAEEWWQLLAPVPEEGRAPRPPSCPAPPEHVGLVYPDLSLDPARIQAKQLLARLFQGTDKEWTVSLDAYRERHGKAEGTLAGHKGRYVDVLHSLAKQRKTQGLLDGDSWPTFGGDAKRGRVISASEEVLDHLSALCREGPTWRFNLEQRVRQDDADASPAVDAAQARTLAFYPVIVGHQVLVSDAQYVTAINVRNGVRKQWYDVAKINGGVNPNGKLPAPPDLRYTLTVAGGHAYVRLGAQDLGVERPAPPLGPPRPPRDNETFLACLRMRPDKEDEHFRWSIRAIAHDHALFEGAPIVAEGQIYIASTRSSSSHAIGAIDCYSADDTSEPPLRWRRDVCETREGKPGEPRYRHHLLTVAGTRIVYCTHSGAVVAVDALTGRHSWAVRYPRRTIDSDEVELRDLAPVLFAAGRLYVAPADSDSLLCLDPATGRTLWELESLRIVHLLGVGQGRLIFTTSKGLRAVRADNGNPVWSVPDSGTLTPAGRGLLIGDLVLFPTTQQRDGISPVETVVYAIRQSDGRPADDPARLHRLPAGNLAYANGCLAVADRQTLSVFVPERLRLQERQEAARNAPPSATTLLALARAEADAGHDETALDTLRQGEEFLRSQARTRAAKKLLGQALITKQQILLKMAQRGADAKRWQDVQSALEQAAAVPLSPRYRLHALLRSAQIWEDAKQTERAAAVWESLRNDKELRTLPVIDRQGRPSTLSVRLAATRRGAREFRALPFGSRLNEIPSLPLLRTWHVRLARDEWILAGWHECDPELLLTGSPDGRFRCRLTSSGEIRWQHRLPFAPRWSVGDANTLVVAGDDGVARLRRDNGTMLWHFPAPAAGRYPRAAHDAFRVVLDPRPPEPLSDFRFVAGRLFFLQGRRRLFALNAADGELLWDRWAPDGALRLASPQGCFSPCYHAGAETILLQTSGHRWLLDAATGRSLHEARDSRELWQRLPLQLDERTLCVTPDPRQVMALDVHTGKCLWRYRGAVGSTLSGEAPSVLGRGDVLIHVQPVNIGYYLHRLDRTTGKPLWPRPRLVTAKTLELNDWVFDSQSLYGIEDRFLTVRSLTDGKILWQRALPAGPAWRARRLGDYLAVFPRAPQFETRFRFRSPLGSVQWDLGSVLAPDAISPLSWYDPKTGQLVQRLNFRIESPARTTFGKRTISQEDAAARIMQTSSLLASEHGPVVRLGSSRPFVALGGEIWGLANGRR